MKRVISRAIEVSDENSNLCAWNTKTPCPHIILTHGDLLVCRAFDRLVGDTETNKPERCDECRMADVTVKAQTQFLCSCGWQGDYLADDASCPNCGESHDAAIVRVAFGSWLAVVPE